MIEILARWNRWGTAHLESGVVRELTARLDRYLHTPEVIALAGPRRAGKTTILYQLMDLLEKAGVPRSALLHVNFEEPGLAPELGLGLMDRLYDLYRTEVHPAGKAYLFLDEVQHVPGWERWVRARSETDGIKVFVTGSSSALMSRELGSLLTGRHVTFPVLPLSFGEFLRFRCIATPAHPRLLGTPPRMQHALGEYLRWGGFPEIVLARDEERKETLLRQYFDDVLFKDVTLRHEVRDAVTLRNLAVHLLTQTSSLISHDRLSRIFGVSQHLVRSYCAYLEEAYLVDFLPFFSLKVAERLRRPQKVHAVDLGLRRAVCLTGSPDLGRIAETAVCGALRREDTGDLFYWKSDQEVDFLIRRGNQVSSLVQVAYEITDEATRLREGKALSQAIGAFPDAQGRLVVSRIAGEPKHDLPAEVEVIPLWQLLLGDRGRVGIPVVSGSASRKPRTAPRRNR